MPPPNTPEEFFEQEHRRNSHAPTSYTTVTTHTWQYTHTPTGSRVVPVRETATETFIPRSRSSGANANHPNNRSNRARRHQSQTRVQTTTRTRRTTTHSSSRTSSRHTSGDERPNMHPHRQSTERQRTRTPPLDYHALEYVGAYDDSLDCPICQSPLVQPIVIECNHIFCHHCLNQTMLHGDTCPIDRKPINFYRSADGQQVRGRAPLIIKNQLDNLQVKCPNKRCDHVCTRSSLGHHYYNECRYTKIPCPDVECDKLVAIIDLAGENECLHHEVDCVHCHKRIDLAELEEHNITDCSQQSVQCEHCRDSIPRKSLSNHTASCPERKHECRYKTGGCTFREKRVDFGDHERHCIYGLVTRMDAAHRAEVDGMKRELRAATDKIRRLEERVESHHHETTTRSSGVLRTPADEVPRAVPIPEAVTPNTPEAKLSHALATMEIHDAKIDNLEKFIGEVDARQNHILVNEVGPVKEQTMDLRNSVGQLHMYVRWLMGSFRQSTKRTVVSGGTAVSPDSNDESSARNTTSSASQGMNNPGTGPSTTTPQSSFRRGSDQNPRL